MRVVLVNKFVHLTGGADQHCLDLAQALTDDGHEVRFLSTADPRNVVAEGEFVVPTVTHASRDGLAPWSQASVFGRALWNGEAAAAMRRLIDGFRPDVVHTHKLYPQLSVAPVFAAARAGVPVVQTLHDFEMVSASPTDARGGLWDTDETRLRFKLLNSATLPVHRRLHAPRVTAFVAVSRFVARVHARYGMDATVLPNFVASVAEPDELPSFDERDGVLFVGRLRPEKGARDVVELARRVPLNVTVVGSGDLDDEIRQASRTIPNLRPEGFVPNAELAQVLRRARVVVVPSRCQEAASLVALEALAQGTPVVAYAVGGLSEYVTDSGGGRIVPVDVDALATAVTELHADREAWESCARRGLTSVAEHNTPAAYVEGLLPLYERVAGLR